MATGIQNKLLIEVDCNVVGGVSYTLPRDGRIADIQIQNISNFPSLVTVTRNGVFLATVANHLPINNMSYAVSIEDGVADCVAGDVLRFTWGPNFLSFFKAYVTLITPVV